MREFRFSGLFISGTMVWVILHIYCVKRSNSLDLTAVPNILLNSRVIS